MKNPIISQKITMFIEMLQGFVSICQKKLDTLALEVPDEYQCGKNCFEKGEISLDEISNQHNSDDYIVTFHLLQTKEMIEEMIASLQLSSKKSVFPAIWWNYALGYWYGTREHLAVIIHRNHPDAFISIYPMENMHDMVQQFFEKRLVDVVERPGRFYISSINLRRLFAERIWWMCYKNHLRTLDCNAVYYYVSEELDCLGQ
ncbi:MAG: hypothetical protein WCP92_08540 [bacterium]